MKNYINLNGTKIKLTPEQVVEMQKSFGVNQIALSTIKIGETFKIGKFEFIVLEHSKETTAVILKELLYENKQFGKSNNFENSYVDDICNEFEITIGDIIGSDNLILHTVDLTADDGLKDYGTIQRKMSLLTTELYRRYVEILDNYKVNKWWWLATALSTPKHDIKYGVKCVSPYGFIDHGRDYDCISGVRPFCILKSNIFVSYED